MAAAAADMEASFVALWAAGAEAAAVELATAFGEATGQGLVERWRSLWFTLFATHRDGGLLSPSAAEPCEPDSFLSPAGPAPAGCVAKLQPEVDEVGYSDAWRARIVADSDNAERYRVPEEAQASRERTAAKARIATGKRTGKRTG